MTQAAKLAAVGSPGVSLGMKNRIINGGMGIDQRNAGNVVTPSTLYSTYTLDRWTAVYTTGSKFSVQQVALGGALPSFPYAMKIVSAGAYSVPSGELYTMNQYIEGYNIADLNWGTANAKTITLSFWVYSSLTGTFGGSLNNADVSRSYPFSYTINSAATWEQKTITVPGDTTGTWLTTSGIGIALRFGLGVGSTYSGTGGTWTSSVNYSVTGATNILGTSGATWYVSGVQLEVGTSATNFDFRSYTTEMQLCQRYFNMIAKNGQTSALGSEFGAGWFYNSGQASWITSFATQMRSQPSLYYGGTSIFYVNNAGQNVTTLNIDVNSINNSSIYSTGLSGTAGQAGVLRCANTGSFIAFSAEL